MRDACGLRQQLYALALLAAHAERLGDGPFPAVVGAGHLETSSLVVKRVCHVLLHHGEQVGVAERDVGHLMAHALGDREGCEALVDEQAHVAVAQVVHAYLLDPALLAAVLHRARDLVFGNREHAVSCVDFRMALEVVGDLLDKEFRELDGSDRLGRLRIRYDVPAVEALIRLVDAHGTALQVEGRWHEREISPSRIPVQ